MEELDYDTSCHQRNKVGWKSSVIKTSCHRALRHHN